MRPPSMGYCPAGLPSKWLEPPSPRSLYCSLLRRGLILSTLHRMLRGFDIEIAERQQERLLAFTPGVVDNQTVGTYIAFSAPFVPPLQVLSICPTAVAY